MGLAFDGDDDRCGVVDNTGEEIFADKVGVMLARDLARQHPNAKFVVDVKSTGLFLTDPVLQELGATTDYWKTGHSYIKRRSHELGALVGFEKSGHYFFNTPIGRGYDDGCVAALAVLDMLDRAPDKTMADLKDDLPKTWGLGFMINEEAAPSGRSAAIGVAARIACNVSPMVVPSGSRQASRSSRGSAPKAPLAMS